MLALALLGWLAQAPAPAGEQQFSEAFHKRRAWEREQTRPSWTDLVAVSVSAFGAAHVLAEGSTPAWVVPGLGLDLELGGHLLPALALVGTAQGRVAFFQPGLEAVVGGFGAGVRLGARQFITLGGGAAFATLTRVTSTAQTGLRPAFELHGGVPLVGKFGLYFRAGLVVLSDGALGDIGVGFGFSS